MATIIRVELNKDGNSVYAQYASGIEKVWSLDKMPKTVSKWLADHEDDCEEPETVEEVAEETQESEKEADPVQTHREAPRTLLTNTTISLSLDIVDRIVSAILIIARISLITSSFLLTISALAIRSGITAYEKTRPLVRESWRNAGEYFWLAQEATGRFCRNAMIIYMASARKAVRNVQKAAVWTAGAAWCIGVMI